MLRQTLHIVLHFLAAASALSACSLKEGRGECPGWYSVSAEAVGAMDVAFYAEDGTGVYERTYSAEELSSGDNAVELPVRRMAVCGVPEGFVRNGRVFVAAGQEFPEVSAFSLVVEPGRGGEEYPVSAGALLRQYADISIRILRSDTGAMSLSVSAPYSGFSLPSLSPSEGEYRAQARSEGDGVFRVRVPRQGGDGLRAHLTREGLEDKDIPLGRLLLDKGYDWTKAGLKPAAVTVNLIGPIYNPFVDAEVDF